MKKGKLLQVQFFYFLVIILSLLSFECENKKVDPSKKCGCTAELKDTRVTKYVYDVCDTDWGTLSNQYQTTVLRIFDCTKSNRSN